MRGPGRPVREITLSLVLTALGDALLGAAMAETLGLPRGSARAVALATLFGGMAETAGFK
ncbi:MAG: TetR family transcriptional regulator [Sphingomonas bacterium]|nr:TetR family transcriptional regulator [Sphingomonas bacterium]